MSKADIKMSECCTCGAKWQTGQDGSHSCSSKLSNDNQALIEALEHIKKHQETVVVGMPQLSATWQIAVRALEQNK